MSAKGRRRNYDAAVKAALARGRKNLVAALGALLLAVNILGAAGLGARADAASPLLSDNGGDRIVICTGAGMMVIGRDGRPIDRAPGETPRLCPFCLPLLHGGLAPEPPLWGPCARAALVVMSAAPVVRAPPPSLRWRALAPRGPPVA